MRCLESRLSRHDRYIICGIAILWSTTINFLAKLELCSTSEPDQTEPLSPNVCRNVQSRSFRGTDIDCSFDGIHSPMSGGIHGHGDISQQAADLGGMHLYVQLRRSWTKLSEACPTSAECRFNRIAIDMDIYDSYRRKSEMIRYRLLLLSRLTAISLVSVKHTISWICARLTCCTPYYNIDYMASVIGVSQNNHKKNVDRILRSLTKKLLFFPACASYASTSPSSETSDAISASRGAGECATPVPCS